MAGPFSVCMHAEPFGATVSHTRIVLDRDQVTMAYGAGPPCRVYPARPVALARATA